MTFQNDTDSTQNVKTNPTLWYIFRQLYHQGRVIIDLLKDVHGKSKSFEKSNGNISSIYQKVKKRRKLCRLQ